jgi:methenyltetrahydrofolate cyclohydrolase
MFLTQSIKRYLDKLSSSSPTPGGGGTSALVGALGASLAIMVSSISVRKFQGLRKKRLSQLIHQLSRLQTQMAQVVDADPKIYNEVMSRYRALKTTRNIKKAKRAMQNSLLKSYRIQARLADQVFLAKRLMVSVGDFAKGSIRNDLLVSSALLDGAFLGAAATARINVVYLSDQKKKRKYEQTLQGLEQKYKKIRFR